MIDYYIHQIGDISSPETYKRLKSILDNRCICSRKKMEELGIEHNYEKSSFKLDIPPEKEWMYYTDDIHKDKVSLSDPSNRFIQRSIERKYHRDFTCFDYNYIGIAISKDIETIPKELTHGLAVGEVQVQDLISEDYIEGLILSFCGEALTNKTTLEIIDAIATLCERCELPLTIYNYEGNVIKEKTSKKTK